MSISVKELTPILNVSDLAGSFAWFAKLGWEKLWEWGNPPDFGCVRNGRCEIFLCVDGQGSRGGPMPRHLWDDDTGGTWITWWLGSPEAVDDAHTLALRENITVTVAPMDMPWGVRECHLRHPDGHTFRVSAGIEAA